MFRRRAPAGLARVQVATWFPTQPMEGNTTMLNRQEYLLVQGASECMEVGHRLTKCLHFGPKESQPGQPLDNGQRVNNEFLDLLGTMRMLWEEGVIPMPDDNFFAQAMDAKRDKIEKYMKYAQQQGTLST